MRPRHPASISTLFPLCIAACTPEADVGGITSASTGEVGTSAVDPSTSAADGGTSTGPGVVETSGTSEADSSGGAPPVLLDVGVETGGVVGCSAESPDLIHVMLPSVPTEIWTYDPVANEFAPFVTVECEQIQGYLTGFALDRGGDVLLLGAEPSGVALPYPTMQLTRLDPSSGDCSVEFVGAMANGTYGVDCADLALVSRPDAPDHERLFAHACTGGGFTVVPGSGFGPLFRMDLADQDPAFTLLDADDHTSVALAGTGDGRLYGVGGDQELPGVGRLIEYDQETGAILSAETIPGLDIGDQGAYIALAFYGGDLYAFGTSDVDASMRISRYDLDDDDGNGLHEITEIELPASAPTTPPAGIIAAASPTCIPLTPEG